MSSDPVLIIVTGLPASGKSTIARTLAADLCLPLIGRDTIKESLFDSLGWSDREWSRRIGMASWDLLYLMLRTQLSANRSVIVDSNFDPERGSADLRRLREQHPFQPFQIHCVAPPHVLLDRFQTRARAGERHPGHADHLSGAEFASLLMRGTDRPLNIGGRVLTVDTTEPGMVNLQEIVDAARAALLGEAA